MKNSFFAVFAVCPVDQNGQLAIAVTTRDGKDAGKIGLPGGKVDQGETAIEALRRESAEEGFNLAIRDDAEPLHVADVEGKLVGWFAAYNPIILDNYKEKLRGIIPCFKSLEEIANAGYGNEWLLSAEMALCHHADMNYQII